MEFDKDKVEEDRLSSLPDEVIHNILSCISMKFVVQTCLLSKRWKLLWASIPSLYFLNGGFCYTSPKFPEFVTNVLKYRNHQVQLSSIKLRMYRSNQVLVRKITQYAFSHNVQELYIGDLVDHEFPPCDFSSHSLKHLTLCFGFISPRSTPTRPWDFPALTTLRLSQIVLKDDKAVDIFSKCVSLKNLRLQECTIMAVEVFHIITPRLSNLMLIGGRYTKVVNLIAPQLENLTINRVGLMEYLNAPAGVSSLYYKGRIPLQLSKHGFHSLNQVNMCLRYDQLMRYKRKEALQAINILQELHSARYLTLNVETIECISTFPDLLSHLPSPFSNLICLSIDSNEREDAYKVRMCRESRNFFFENSPNATFTMELPEEGLSLDFPGTCAPHLKYVREYTFIASTAIVDDSASYNNKKNKKKKKKMRRKKNKINKKLTILDAVRVIQMTFRAYLMRRSKTLCALRDLAIAKGELKDIPYSCMPNDVWMDPF